VDEYVVDLADRSPFRSFQEANFPEDDGVNSAQKRITYPTEDHGLFAETMRAGGTQSPVGTVGNGDAVLRFNVLAQ